MSNWWPGSRHPDRPTLQGRCRRARRHKAAHLSPALVRIETEVLRDGSARNAREELLASLVEDLRSLGERAERMLEVAEERRILQRRGQPDERGARCRRTDRPLRGVLDERPVSMCVNVLASPEMAVAVAAILAATERFPEARLAIADAMDELAALPPGDSS